MRAGVEVLSWSGCPSYEGALAQLERVMASIGRADVPVTTRWLETDEAATAARFLGSPSYRVDDEEVLAAGDAGGPYALGPVTLPSLDGYRILFAICAGAAAAAAVTALLAPGRSRPTA